MPAFVDLQVNGFLGVDFASPSLSLEEIGKVCLALARRGTGGFLATVITSPGETYEHVLPLLVQAIKHPPPGARILGIHLEGPFISAAEGAIGAHPPHCVQAPSLESLDRLISLAEGHLRLLTVAPELPNVRALIRHAVAAGVTVSIGHTLATAADIARAESAGATLITHLGNGCPILMHRHNNPLVAQLVSGLIPMIITDGCHLPPEFIRLVERVHGRDHIIVTSDAAPVAGCPPGEYNVFGNHAVLDQSGVIHCSRDPRVLAGSSASMLECMNTLAALGWTETQLRQAGHDTPLAAIGLDDDLPHDIDTIWDDTRFSVNNAGSL